MTTRGEASDLFAPAATAVTAIVQDYYERTALLWRRSSRLLLCMEPAVM